MRAITVVILVACAGSVANADPAKYTRKTAPPDVQVSDRAKPVQPPVAKPAEPVVTANDIIAAETRIQPIRVEQEKLLEKLAYDTPDNDPTKPEILFRLAEQYAHQIVFWKIKAVEEEKRRRR